MGRGRWSRNRRNQEAGTHQSWGRGDRGYGDGLELTRAAEATSRGRTKPWAGAGRSSSPASRGGARRRRAGTALPVAGGRRAALAASPRRGETPLAARRSGEQGRSSSPASGERRSRRHRAGEESCCGRRDAARARAGGRRTGPGDGICCCNWAGPYPLTLIRVSQQWYVSWPAYPNFAILIKIWYSADTYPLRIGYVSVSKACPIRDTAVNWSIRVF
jgi:hypothetical protein